MFKNVAGQFVDVALVLRESGDNATGLTPIVRIKQDGGAWGAAAGVTKEGENGSYEYAPTQGETNCDHLVVKFTEATVLTVLINLYPIDAALYKADISGLSTFDHATDQVITDTASREASKADVTGLSTFDPSTDEVITDAASRTASQADVSALSTQASVDLIPKRGDGDAYRQLRDGAGAIQQQIRETITATEQ